MCRLGVQLLTGFLLLAQIGMVFLAAATVGVMMLIIDVVAGFWVLLPLAMRETNGHGPPQNRRAANQESPQQLIWLVVFLRGTY